jgi:hypothetical protein
MWNNKTIFADMRNNNLYSMPYAGIDRIEVQYNVNYCAYTGLLYKNDKWVGNCFIDNLDKLDELKSYFPQLIFNWIRCGVILEGKLNPDYLK